MSTNFLARSRRLRSLVTRLFLIVFVLVFVRSELLLAADYASPNQRYLAKVTEDEFRTKTLTIWQGNRAISSTGSGYGGFPEVLWSPDSQYLAFVDRGTKTTTNLTVCFMNSGNVKIVDLPDFRLNILGRFQKIEGGRYQFVEQLKWIKEGVLEMLVKGSLVDGASNPKDHPENWYSFRVQVNFIGTKATLHAVEISQ